MPETAPTSPCPRCGTPVQFRAVGGACPLCSHADPSQRPAASRYAEMDEHGRRLMLIAVATVVNVLVLAVLGAMLLRA